MLKPIALGPNQPSRFYRGGPAIASFRGLPENGDRVPEDWIGSTTTLFGQSELGLSRLPSGELLRDVVHSDPNAWLGPAHVDHLGDQPSLLVKLLDAGERLPVHAHPDRNFARTHLQSPHGKSEAWLILSTSGTGQVHLGFKKDVSRQTLSRWVRDQDSEAMLDSMHAIGVGPGDCVFVPGGLPHAIGAGILLLELQEPTDLSVLLEWKGFDIDGRTDGHLGLGFAVALDSINRSGWSAGDISQLRNRNMSNGPVDRPLPDTATAFFRLERLRAANPIVLDAAFSILVVTAGHGELRTTDGEPVRIQRGNTMLIPYSSGPVELSGGAEVLRCQPPAP
jgi:mannose-6-phosphate isomerase